MHGLLHLPWSWHRGDWDSDCCPESGQSIALAGDVLAVGAWKDDQGQGSISLFRRAGGGWIRAGRVTASDGMAGDGFGYSLAAFGNRMVTGAHTAGFISPDGGADYVLALKPRAEQGARETIPAGSSLSALLSFQG